MATGTYSAQLGDRALHACAQLDCWQQHTIREDGILALTHDQTGKQRRHKVYAGTRVAFTWFSLTASPSLGHDKCAGLRCTRIRPHDVLAAHQGFCSVQCADNHGVRVSAEDPIDVAEREAARGGRLLVWANSEMLDEAKGALAAAGIGYRIGVVDALRYRTALYVAATEGFRYDAGTWGGVRTQVWVEGTELWIHRDQVDSAPDQPAAAIPAPDPSDWAPGPQTLAEIQDEIADHIRDVRITKDGKVDIRAPGDHSIEWTASMAAEGKRRAEILEHLNDLEKRKRFRVSRKAERLASKRAALTPDGIAEVSRKVQAAATGPMASYENAKAAGIVSTREQYDKLAAMRVALHGEQAGPCPDCNGTGEYVGLAERRPCPTCTVTCGDRAIWGRTLRGGRTAEMVAEAKARCAKGQRVLLVCRDEAQASKVAAEHGGTVVRSSDRTRDDVADVWGVTWQPPTCKGDRDA